MTKDQQARSYVKRSPTAQHAMTLLNGVGTGGLRYTVFLAILAAYNAGRRNPLPNRRPLI